MTDLQCRRVTPTFGAELSAPRLTELDDDGIAELQAAVVEHGVVFLRDQHLSDTEHLALAARFGQLSVYPVLRLAGEERPLEFIEDTADDPPKADRWHSDLTWLVAPPKFAFLSMLVAPATGGDTVWADTQGAFEALSPVLRDVLTPLRVRHRVEPASFDRFEARYGPEVGARFRTEYGDGALHPLVRRNPDSGRDALFLGGYWMDAIDGMHRWESDPLLEALMAHATQDDHTVRWHWTVGDLALWDERRTLHIATNDHYPQHRKVRRCTVDGEVPMPGGSSLAGVAATATR
jgi:taurine dioxygenase